MTELLQILFDYALKQQSLFSLQGQQQYLESQSMCKRSYEKLHTLLSGEERKCLENYAGELEILHDLDMESIFCTGLAMGLELSRM